MVENIISAPPPTSFSKEKSQGDWVCTVSRDEANSLNTIVCRNAMPKEQGKFPTATFRWMPEWGVVEQWGYHNIDGSA